MPKWLRLSLVPALLTVAVLALGGSVASAAPKDVAYVCHGEDICLLDPDNPGDVYNLTANGTTSYDEDPVWSPDGKRLAFVARFTSQFPPQTNIYTMEPDAPGQEGISDANRQLTRSLRRHLATAALGDGPSRDHGLATRTIRRRFAERRAVDSHLGRLFASINVIRARRLARGGSATTTRADGPRSVA